MRLWILRANETNQVGNPWEPWYDKCFAFVVRAESETAARQIADKNADDENSNKYPHPWLDSTYSACDPLTEEGEEGVVIRDYRSA